MRSTGLEVLERNFAVQENRRSCRKSWPSFRLRQILRLYAAPYPKRQSRWVAKGLYSRARLQLARLHQPPTGSPPNYLSGQPKVGFKNWAGNEPNQPTAQLGRLDPPAEPL